tara:strand:+ start:109 stop:528 length:420 start_codon:yes stop_codon:yes gene_type:complete
MKLINIFKTLIVANFVIIFLNLFDWYSLVETEINLEEVILNADSSFMTMFGENTLFFLLASILITILSYVLMFFFVSYSRQFFIINALVLHGFFLYSGLQGDYSITTPIYSELAAFESMIAGAILVLSFTSPLSNNWNK